MREWLSDMKVELYKVQLYLEKKSSLHLFLIFSYAVISAIVTFHDFIQILSSLPRFIFSLLNFLFILFLLVLDALHVKIIKMSRFELDGRKLLINELISTQPPYYKVKHRKELHIIEKDGDSEYHREMILAYDNVEINWAEITLASTTSYGTDYSTMILTARSHPDQKFNLARVPLQAEGSRIRFAIILHNKLTSTNPNEGFHASMKWKGIWTNLIDHNKDDGIVRFDHDTEDFIIELQLPQGYRFLDFRMPRTSGEQQIGQTDSGRSYLTYRLRNQKKGDFYQYFVEVEKVS